MDGFQFTSEMTRALAWPLAIVIVALIFRRRIGELLVKLRKLEGPGGLKADFAAEVVAVTQQVEQAKIPSPNDKQRPSTALAAEYDKALSNRWRLRAMEDRPSAIVLGAWNLVEQEIGELFRRKPTVGMSDDYRPLSHEDMLIAVGIPAQIANTIASLRTLRNKVAHSSAFEPDMQSAVEYARNAERVIAALRAAK